MMMIFKPLRPMPEGDPYAVILAARASLKARKEQLDEWVARERGGRVFQAPSEKTIADYRKDVDRLIKQDNPWQAAATTTKKLTWLKRKSALLTISQVEIADLLKAQDKMQRSGELKSNPENVATWMEMIKKIHYYTSIIESKPPEPDINRPEDHPLQIKTPRKSKRNAGKLPDDWRETLVRRMPTWHGQVLICAITGCRPSEIEAGIHLEVINGELRALISGKKTGPYSGQDKRGLTWSLDNAAPLVLEMVELVKKSGGKMTVDYSRHAGKSPAKTFSSAMTQAGKRCFPGSKITLTPYSLRHAMASDLKASKLTAQDVSKALGHQSLETQATYGHASMSKTGSMAPASVKASSKVRGVVSVMPSGLAGKIKKTKPIMAAEPKAVVAI